MAANRNKKKTVCCKDKNKLVPSYTCMPSSSQNVLYVKYSDRNYYITMRNNTKTKKQ